MPPVSLVVCKCVLCAMQYLEEVGITEVIGRKLTGGSEHAEVLQEREEEVQVVSEHAAADAQLQHEEDSEDEGPLAR
ncbi:hypothetical protein NDU88_001794 [Pleurodeles waltl]|uniref:Uncharacterized protein n=1 Tax=Pleurodeles waltl TaxID=8319 RepID=A0AAV7UTS8_PLEWA|nr:hypothetical protein NDU88_001794 [Pleurodeles waltl]